MTSAAHRIFPLSCGATLLVEPMPDVQSASLCLLVPAGTIYERPGANGTASILSDVVTRGAGNRDARELSAAFDRIGVQRSESAGWNFITFSASLVAEHLPATLSLYADILLRPMLPKAEFEPARVGVEQSLRGMEDDPQRKLFVELRRSAYDDPWGRPVEGSLDEISRIRWKDVTTLATTGLRPNGTILGVAGRVDPEAVYEHVETLLTKWSPRPEPTPTVTPRQPSPRHLTHDATQTHIGIAWDAVPYGAPDYYAAWAATNVLGGASSSRLFTEVRERRGLCYSVSASLNSVREEGRVFAYVGTTTERAQETLDVTLREIARLREGIDEAELERCKAMAKSTLVMQQESTSSRAASIARDWFALGRVTTLEEIHQRVQALRAADLLEYLERHPAKNFAIVTVGAEPLSMPSIPPQ